MKSQQFLILWLLIVFASTGAPSTNVLAQGRDTVYRSNGRAGSIKITGKVIDMSPTEIVVESKGASTKIPASEIRSVIYSGQSSAITRTAERINAGNYAQGLEEVGKIEDKGNFYVAHELAYLKAYAEGHLALQGSFGARKAGTSLNNFLTKYKKSYHFAPATELKGRLLYALKFLDLAKAEFKLLTQSNWPQYVIKGHYHLAQTAIAQNNFDEAAAQCQQIIGFPDNDDTSPTYQLLAKCVQAKAQCLAGNPGTAEDDIKRIIKVENPDNQAVFAAAYNALGVCYLKSGQLKEAREKFLMTHLLMYSESESHAEALYYLSQIWPQLENTDEANKTRELLKSRYRNSYWAKILN